jgi:hypothetical protein
MSLFPGLGYAAGYKIAQRVYKFGGQPYFRDMLDRNSGGWFRDTFGAKKGGMLMHAAAGRWVKCILWVKSDADGQYDWYRRSRTS